MYIYIYIYVPGDDFPSIWKLPLVQLILTLPGAARVELAQGLLGADSPKPTELLAVNLPSIQHDICSWRITSDLPRNSNIGRNQDGVFKTTQLKEYPPAFCAALAQCTVTAMSCYDTAEQIHVDEHFLQQCQQMVSRDFGTFIGPDHAIWRLLVFVLLLLFGFVFVFWFDRCQVIWWRQFLHATSFCLWAGIEFTEHRPLRIATLSLLEKIYILYIYVPVTTNQP